MADPNVQGPTTRPCDDPGGVCNRVAAKQLLRCAVTVGLEAFIDACDAPRCHSDNTQQKSYIHEKKPT